MNLEKIFNQHQHPIQDAYYTQYCKAQLDSIGALVMENFLSVDTLESLQNEAREVRPLAYFCSQNHNAYLLDSDPSLPDEHIRNLEHVSDKGCVPHDQIPANSPSEPYMNGRFSEHFWKVSLTYRFILMQTNFLRLI